jgi:hypothetical protein
MSKTMRGMTILLMVLTPLASLGSETTIAAERDRIAVFSGPRATIQSSPPLVTSNKARQKYGLPLIEQYEFDIVGFDHMVPQRLAKPVEVLIEAYTAHPLEMDASELYAPADASRVFEEIDRGLYGVDGEGLANALSSRANFDFIRALPSGGYKKGLSAEYRTDKGDGDIPAETLGKDMFIYKPFHLGNFTRFHDLARASNAMQSTLDSGEYAGGIWFEASPSIEETIYWLNIITDTQIPIVGVAAQRAQRSLSADGPANILDSVNYILSGKWAGADGKDDLGAVMIEAERIFAARQVQKSDARPGGYIATGDHGGVLGSVVKMSHYSQDTSSQLAEPAADILLQIADKLLSSPLAGFVAEGESPYGNMTTEQTKALEIAVYSGMPVVSVGRGNAGGPTALRPYNVFIEGNNLSAPKARLLLMACMMKFGSMPTAKFPEKPSYSERQAVQDLISKYQEIFDTH